MPETETHLGQILRDGRWRDYSRGTAAQARAWQAQDPTRRRVVDWIDKNVVLVAPSEA